MRNKTYYTLWPNWARGYRVMSAYTQLQSVDISFNVTHLIQAGL